MGRYRWALAAAAAALACASCSSSTTTPGDGSTSPATGSSGSGPHLTAQAAAPLLVQCFIAHHLISKAQLATGKTSKPPSDSSTWLHDGKVRGNLRFGDWYSTTGSAIVVDGKQIATWATSVAASSNAWPTGTCGPIPG
jgi:hypothetical protein